MRIFFVRLAIPVGDAALATLLVACRSGSTESAPVMDTSSAPAASVPPAAPSAKPSSPGPQARADLVLEPEGFPPYDGPTGSVEGTILVQGPPAPPVAVSTSQCPSALDTYGQLFRDGKPETPNGPRPLADAVVVVIGYTGFYLPDRHDSVQITIGRDCAYPSRTIAITYGQRLEISNQSKLLFAPAIDQSTATAVMVAPPGQNGDPVRLYPEKAGYFALTDRMQT